MIPPYTFPPLLVAASSCCDKRPDLDGLRCDISSILEGVSVDRVDISPHVAASEVGVEIDRNQDRHQ